MVQTEQQYICIYQCLLAVLEGNELAAPLRQIHDNSGFQGNDFLIFTFNHMIRTWFKFLLKDICLLVKFRHIVSTMYIGIYARPFLEKIVVALLLSY